ncbi:MAG: HEAT repeat domain-containing protein, partial [Elusimicrobiota bacterium]|nr:HEAT repeat domain-containing protein [Elusimicrobiota bacterium]
KPEESKPVESKPEESKPEDSKSEEAGPVNPLPEAEAAEDKPRSAGNAGPCCGGEDTTASSFCVTMGKCSGNTYRALSENSDRLTKCLGGAAKAIADEAHMISMRLGNLFKTVRKDTQLTHWELKRRDDFARLGEEIFRRKEAELEKTETDEDFKALLAQVREDEERIRDIEDEKNVQRRKMRDESTYGHATTQLKNPDPRIRRAALRILMRLGRSEAISKITPLLKDADAEVRAKAREAISSLSDQEEAAPSQETGEEENYERSGKGTEHAGQPAAEQSASEQPAADQPAGEQPAGGQPAAEHGGQQAEHPHKLSKKERREQR